MTSTPTRPRTRSRFHWPVHGVVAHVTLVILVVFLILAVFGQFLTPFDPNKVGVGPQLAGPSPRFWLGTDSLGRDELSRIIAGARPAILAAVESIALAGVVGIAIGVIAGYLGGLWDGLLSRLMDLLFAFPEYLLAILVVAILGNGLTNVAIAIGVICVPRFARVARGSTKEVLSRSYVEAAVLSHRGRWWIMWRHVLPNISSPLIVMTAISLSTAEGAYASLAFLGFGELPPTADFGSMIAAAQPYLLSSPWQVLYPSIVFVVLVVAFNLLGDVLRDRLDPRSASSVARRGRALVSRPAMSLERAGVAPPTTAGDPA
jgi:peptide/nickel transport system permease protein